MVQEKPAETKVAEDIPTETLTQAGPKKAALLIKKTVLSKRRGKGGRGKGGAKGHKTEVNLDAWVPRTKLGKMVREGKVINMSDALATRLPLREPQIVDILLPNLEDEVLDVNMVQRMTDSGRRVKFAVTTVVGNSDGFIGIGHAKGKEVRIAIEKSLDDAKLNIIEIKRGCGSWECGCGTPHSVPFEVTGKCGSAILTIRPAPRGVSLAAADVAKHILRLAGIKDAWTLTNGKTRTTVNFVAATYDALLKTSKVKVTFDQKEKLKIVSGGVIP